MLWTLIISLILRKQLHDRQLSKYPADTSEHAPGFHELDAVRLEKLANIMENKLNSATARYDNIAQSMTRASQNNKSPQIQHWIALKMCTAREKVHKSQMKFKTANQDLIDSRQTLSEKSNRIVTSAYDVAYETSTKQLLYKLFGARFK